MSQSLRVLARAPLFTATVILLLGAGLGANLTVYSLLDSLTIATLAVPHPGELVTFELLRDNNIPETQFNELYCRLLQQRAKSFSSVFASGDADMLYQSGDRAMPVYVHQVSKNYIQALGIKLSIGVPFSDDDETAGRYTALLSHGFWKHEFGSRPDITGKTILLRGSPFTIAGVLPPDFNGMNVDAAPDLYIPAWTVSRWAPRAARIGPPVFIYARLNPSSTLEQARAEFATLYTSLVETEIAVTAEADPERLRDNQRARRPWIERAAGGRSTLRTQFALPLRVLMVAVVLLLGLVAVNVSGLLLARGEARVRETAVRLSLGATRFQIASLIFREGAILVAGGIVVAVGIARWGISLMLAALPSRRPLSFHPEANMRVLIYAIAACAITALLASVVPMLRLSRGDLTSLMARSTPRVPRRRAVLVFIVVQVALATILSIGGIAMAVSLHQLRTADPGFNPNRMLVLDMATGLGPGRATAEDLATILRQTREMPGVEDASIAAGALMRGVGLKNTVAPTGTRAESTDLLNASLNIATPNHVRNLGMRLLAGRAFADADTLAQRPTPAIVTMSFAHKFFPGVNPIGQHFGTGVNKVAGPDHEIIGVVADSKYRSMREEAPPTFFLAAPPTADDFKYDGFALYVHERGKDPSVSAALRSLWSTRGFNVTHLATFQTEMEASVWREHLLAALTSRFAALAAFLTAAGLYGALAQDIRRRRREIGIRMALGATARHIAGIVTRDAALSVLPGLAAGAVIYAATAQWLAPLLYRTRPGSTPLIIAGALFIGLTTLLATFLPTQRAISIQPSEALRDDR